MRKHIKDMLDNVSRLLLMIFVFLFPFVRLNNFINWNSLEYIDLLSSTWISLTIIHFLVSISGFIGILLSIKKIKNSKG